VAQSASASGPDQTTRPDPHREPSRPAASRSSGASPAGRGCSPRPRREGGEARTTAREGQSADTTRSRPPGPPSTPAPRPSRARSPSLRSTIVCIRRRRYYRPACAVNRTAGSAAIRPSPTQVVSDEEVVELKVEGRHVQTDSIQVRGDSVDSRSHAVSLQAPLSRQHGGSVTTRGTVTRRATEPLAGPWDPVWADDEMVRVVIRRVPYSCCSATTGSMREARRAGTKQASAATPSSATEATAAAER
jgi:hypothetical protein